MATSTTHNKDINYTLFFTESKQKLSALVNKTVLSTMDSSLTADRLIQDQGEFHNSWPVVSYFLALCNLAWNQWCNGLLN